jgi:hypothetical protein
VKKVLAWAMVALSAAGIVATQLEFVGKSEPRLVLQLSWMALLFSGLDGIFVTHED